MGKLSTRGQCKRSKKEEIGSSSSSTVIKSLPYKLLTGQDWRFGTYGVIIVIVEHAVENISYGLDRAFVGDPLHQSQILVEGPTQNGNG